MSPAHLILHTCHLSPCRHLPGPAAPDGAGEVGRVVGGHPGHGAAPAGDQAQDGADPAAVQLPIPGLTTTLYFRPETIVKITTSKSIINAI